MKKLLLLLSSFISSVSFCLAQNSRIIDRGQYLELILGDSAEFIKHPTTTPQLNRR